MRRLLATLGALGLLVGLGGALVLHGLPTGIVGHFGWTGSLPPDVPLRGFDVAVTLNWLPSLVVLPGLGLIVGLLLGAVLARLGWRLVRREVG